MPGIGLLNTIGVFAAFHLFFIHDLHSFSTSSWLMILIYAIGCVIRYVSDEKNFSDDVKLLVSSENEVFGDYEQEMCDTMLGLVVVLGVVIGLANIFMHLPALQVCKSILVFILIYIFGALPFSKEDFQNWLNDAPRRKQEKLKAAQKAAQAKK